MSTFKRLPFLVGLSMFLLFACSQDPLNDSSLLVPRQESAASHSYVVGLVETGEETSHMDKPALAAKAGELDQFSRRLLEDWKISPVQLRKVFPNSQMFQAQLLPGQAQSLSTDSRVAFVEEDIRIAVDPKLEVAGMQVNDQRTPWGVRRVGSAKYVSLRRKVFILDTGIDTDHPDLNVHPEFGFTLFEDTDDPHGHGTHVAGVIGALNNGFGVKGIAPGAIVVPVRILDERGSGTLSGIIEGIEFVAAHGNPKDVANLSLVGPYLESINRAVIRAAKRKIYFVVAAGNNGRDATQYSPASADHRYVLTISAMDRSGKFAAFSNYGKVVDWCAPGVSILSTYKNGGYAVMSGTSMAAPHAAAIALLVRPSSDGFVREDPDGTPDPIIHKGGLPGIMFRF